MLADLVKIFAPTAMAFFLGLLFTPVATHFFFKYKMWKKFSRADSSSNADFQRVHNGKEELHTPRTGGMIVWLSVLLTTSVFYFASLFFPSDLTLKLNFLSRNQTLIPFFTLLLCALLGFWDDLIQIYGHGKFARDDASWRKWKVTLIAAVSLAIGIWFYYKLGMQAVHIPFGGELFLGSLIVPFFVLVALATFSGGVVDGIDGLSGGIFASIFGAYAAIAFAGNQIDLAAFSGTITGATLAFLWFNIPPARFYMGESGIMGLTVTLATLAFLTDSVFILPVVAIILVASSGSVILQDLSKRFSGRKLFRLAPLHHHLEAIGWPRYKITMRFWVLSVVFSIIGVILAIISK